MLDHRLRIAYCDGVDVARVAPADVAALAGSANRDVSLLLGFTPRSRPWLQDANLCGHTTHAGYSLAGAVADGRLKYLPVRLSAVPRLLADVIRPDVVVVSGVRRASGVAFAGNVGWGPAAVRYATAVVVEIAEGAPDFGGPLIEGNVVAVVDAPVDEAAPSFRAPDEIDMAIGRHVVSILPDDPTIQLGPGGVPDAIVASLDRPVRVWSGVVTDTVGQLVERGLLVGDVTTAYTWGGAPIAELHRAGRLRLVSVEETHDISVLSAIPRFVGLNTALQLGLDGSVNVERVGGRVITGIGGHADFCLGASRSVGGLSIVAVRSTAKGGASTIVPQVDVVSTPHSDVEIIVTEHGIADLRGLDDAERALRIIGVAAPEHRDALRHAATSKRS